MKTQSAETPRGARSRLAAAVWVVVLASVSAAVQGQQAWKPDWKVRCTWEEGLVSTALLEELLERVPDLAEELVEALEAGVCDDAVASFAGDARVQLRAAGRWYESLGFPGPYVESFPDDARKYLAWLDVFRFEEYDPFRRRSFVGANGSYDPSGSGTIHLAPSRQYAVEAHELFHGVQKRVAQRMHPAVLPDQWVWEGTARAADTVWSLKAGRETKYEVRPFDKPLGRYQFRYGTAPFWKDVGRQLRSPDRVQYMHEVFDRLDESGGAPSLVDVDVALESEFSDRGIVDSSLAEAYAEFVRFKLRRDSPWMFETIHEVPIQLTGNGAEALEVHFGRLSPMSTDAILVRVSVPPSQTASLRVEFDFDESYLHLVVDDRRYNRTPAADDKNGKRNRFSTIVPGNVQEQLFWVRVANTRYEPYIKAEYRLDVTLTSAEGNGRSVGAEDVSFDDGVFFTYVNKNRDPNELARNTIGGLISRNADVAGVPRDSASGMSSGLSRTLDEVLGPGTAPPFDGAGRSSVTRGADCAATTTLFEDSNRTVVKLIWHGADPLLGGKHDVDAFFATNIHDSLYSEFKNLGQLDLADDPVAREQYLKDFATKTIPATLDLYRQAPRIPMGDMIEEAVENITGPLPFIGRWRGRKKARSTGDPNLTNLFEGKGTLEVEPSPGDKIEAKFHFDATNGSNRRVSVSGEFVTVPGTFSADHLWNGCERLFVPEEDNEDPPLEPAVFPPGVDGEVKEITPIILPWPCIPRGNQTTTEVLADWSDVRTEPDGTRVQQRRVRKTPVVLIPATPLVGSTSLCAPREEVETRRLPPDVDPVEPRDCKSGPPEEWSVDVGDWRAATVGGERLWERTVRYTPNVLEPALHGGDDSSCRPFDGVQRSRTPVPPDDEDAEQKGCVPGPMREWLIEVLEDWHPAKIAGTEVDQRVVRKTPTILSPPSPGGSWERCQPRTIVETRPKRFRLPPGDGVLGDPDPGAEPDSGSNGQPAMDPPTSDSSQELEGPLVLDFLEAGDANVVSSPQQVAGSASPVAVSLEGPFDMAFRFDRADLAACNDPIVRSALGATGSVPQSAVLKLDATAGRLDLTLAARGGEIRLSGPVQLSAASPVGVLGVMIGGHVELHSGADSYSCRGLLDLSFMVTETP